MGCAKKLVLFFQPQTLFWSGLIFLGLFGLLQLETKTLDQFSEQIALQEAKQILNGEHRFGIVKATRYPNGPLYALLPLLALGVENTKILRLLPLFFALFSIGIFILVFLIECKDEHLKKLLLLGFFSIFYQPGIVNWLGALHEHSFALSFTLLSGALAFHQTNKNLFFSLLILGFLSAWVGFDWLPSQTFFVMGCYYLKNQNFKYSFFQGMIFTLGGTLGVGLHLIQNWAYYGNLRLALQDILGSGAARMGIESIAQNLDPNYLAHLKEKTPEATWKLTPWAQILIQPAKFIVQGWLGIIPTLGFFIWVGLTVKPIKRLWDYRYWIFYAYLTGIIWSGLMPQHAHFHGIFLPRHLYLSFLLLIPALLKTKPVVQ